MGSAFGTRQRRVRTKHEKITINDLMKWKQEGRKFATSTAYDASFAQLFESQEMPVLLVGDSLGMVLQGEADTLPVTVDDIAYHTRCVRKGSPNCLLMADMPFMSYATPEQACENAAKLVRAGANMVKIEGGDWLVDTVKMLTERAVPVCAHLGLTPQSVNISAATKSKAVNKIKRIAWYVMRWLCKKRAHKLSC